MYKSSLLQQCMSSCLKNPIKVYYSPAGAIDGFLFFQTTLFIDGYQDVKRMSTNKIKKGLPTISSMLYFGPL